MMVNELPSLLTRGVTLHSPLPPNLSSAVSPLSSRLPNVSNASGAKKSSLSLPTGTWYVKVGPQKPEDVGFDGKHTAVLELNEEYKHVYVGYDAYEGRTSVPRRVKVAWLFPRDVVTMDFRD